MRIIILGNGISGVTCARFLRKHSNHNITLISDECDEFFSRTALMYVYMGQMRPRDVRPYESWFWEKNRINRIKTRIESIDFHQKLLVDEQGNFMPYDKLVLALGSIPNKFGWPGQDLDGVQGLYHWQDLESMEYHSRGLERAVIVGGGLIGVEMAEMFHSRGIPITLLVREKAYSETVLPKEEAEMVGRHLRSHGIDLRLETELQAIEPDASGKKCAAVLTHSGERIPCGFVGLTAGVRPNIDFLLNSRLETGRGVLVDPNLKTNIPDVLAIGDCAELRQPAPGRKPIEALWYTGRMMGETAAYNLLASPGSEKVYDPGIWFNSAKFFDIEYQIYGSVPAQLPDHMDSIYWEHPEGKQSIRLVFDKQHRKIIGFNLMGIRYRQEVCEQWIRTQASMEEVLANLGLANFDPEFSDQYEQELLSVYQEKTGLEIHLKQKRGLPGVLRFLQKRTTDPTVHTNPNQL